LSLSAIRDQHAATLLNLEPLDEAAGFGTGLPLPTPVAIILLSDMPSIRSHDFIGSQQVGKALSGLYVLTLIIRRSLATYVIELDTVS
jgi:hypothetical protein